MPAYWVNSAACVDVARNKITHKLAHGELIETEPWLKDGPITIGTALQMYPYSQVLAQDALPAVALYTRLRWPHQTKDKNANVGIRCI